MARRKTVVEILEAIHLHVSTDCSTDLLSVEGQSFTVYKYELVCNYHQKEFRWFITRTYIEFASLWKTLSREIHLADYVEALPLPREFNQMSSDAQLARLRNILKSLLRNPLFAQNEEMLAFVEISANSFLSDKKYKEGYVRKVGSGRKINQSRFCNCYGFCHREHKKWLRVGEFGLEYSQTHGKSDVAEVILFSKSFQIKTGRKHTGSSTGIRLTNDQHNFIFKTTSLKERHEFAEAIQAAFDDTPYGNFVGDYGSSFLSRPFNTCRWYVDGHDYFADVYEALQNAKFYVYISDWWMSPEHYLLRPPAEHPESKLVEVLGSIADRGVQVYVHLYKEVSFSLTINSLHTKHALLLRSRNIKVLRHPNFSISAGIPLWSHHEKVVVVDGEVGFLGGLDLCHGRYDTPEHLLTDTEKPFRWKHIDYSNVRVADFTDVKHWKVPTIDRQTVPRMPWHDIAVSVRGQVVRDLEYHFRELWNHVIRDTTAGNRKQKVLGMNSHTALQRHKSMREDLSQTASAPDRNKAKKIHKYNTKPEILLDEEGVQEQTLNILEKGSGMEFAKRIEPKSTNPRNLITQIFSKVISDILFLKPQVTISAVRREELIHEKEEEEAQEPLTATEFPLKLSNNPEVSVAESQGGSCRCQLLRSGGRWSLGRPEAEHSILTGYLALIENAQHFIYIENQFFISDTAGKPVLNPVGTALQQRILRAARRNEPFKVIVVLPLLPGFEGGVDDANASVLRVQLHYQYRTITRGKHSLLGWLRQQGVNPARYIRFYGLRAHAVLRDTPVTEMIYVHSKLMIVDDRSVLVGSANINDRSLLGERDSELAVLIEDKNEVVSQMAGSEFLASEFAQSLRLQLFQEHAGEPNIANLIDPFSPEFEEVWERRAAENTHLFRIIFRCYPDDDMQSASQVRQLTQRAKLDQYEDAGAGIFGHLVEFPLRFLEGENLKLKVTNKEYYLKDETFT